MPDQVDWVVEREAAWLAGQVRGVAERLRPAGQLACSDCGEVIPERRRQAHPAARRCVACQQALEGRA
jgi:phage/conjugal plasmid C-4 type zinc finger TraR family protein